MAEAKDKKAAAKTSAPKAAKPKAQAKTPAGATAAGGKGKATAAAATGEPHCCVEKCKQPVRAKGYCRKHYVGWRREAVGKHHRYKICTKEGCRKPRRFGSLCDEHGGKKAPAGEAAAAPPAA